MRRLWTWRNQSQRRRRRKKKGCWCVLPALPALPACPSCLPCLPVCLFCPFCLPAHPCLLACLLACLPTCAVHHLITSRSCYCACAWVAQEEEEEEPIFEGLQIDDAIQHYSKSAKSWLDGRVIKDIAVDRVRIGYQKPDGTHIHMLALLSCGLTWA